MNPQDIMNQNQNQGVNQFTKMNLGGNNVYQPSVNPDFNASAPSMNQMMMNQNQDLSNPQMYYPTQSNTQPVYNQMEIPTNSQMYENYQYPYMQKAPTQQSPNINIQQQFVPQNISNLSQPQLNQNNMNQQQMMMMMNQMQNLMKMQSNEISRLKKQTVQQQQPKQSSTLIESIKCSTAISRSQQGINTSSSQKRNKIVEVLYDYTPSVKTKSFKELTIRKGDIIEVEKENPDGWWYGKHTVTKNKGYFPSNYVKFSGYSNSSFSKSSSSIPKQSKKAGKKAKKDKKYVKVIFDYNTSGEEDTKSYLSLHAGDVIKVIEENESGWWYGKVKRTKKEGYFPSNYVEVMEKILETVVCEVDYTQQTKSELTMKVGEKINVTIRNKDGWWYGRNSETKVKGYFPYNFTSAKK